MNQKTCYGCALPETYCACSNETISSLPVRFALLLHENEPGRPSNTSRLITQLFPDSCSFTWQRKEPPQALIDMIQSEQYQPWLLFPADRPDLTERLRPYESASERTPLIIVPDGTWKEVRKMVRKSPWLDPIPLLALNPTAPTRYTLRRNPDANHLCTAETVAEVLRVVNAPKAADLLDQRLDRFLLHYQAWKCNHPPIEQR